MSQTIEEQITENLQVALDNIRIASGNNFDVYSNEADIQGTENESLNATIVSGPLRPRLASLGHDEYDKRLYVVCPITLSDNIEGDTEERARSRIIGEIIKAVDADYTLGGLAINTTFVNANPEMDQQVSGAVCAFDVWFSTLKGNPFAQ